MYNIQLLNKISPLGLALLDQKLYKTGEDIENPTAIIVRSAKMHDMEIPQSVLGIARAGAGVNNIPIDKCTEQGVVVFNTPGANANAVKELTILGLLMSARKVSPSLQWVQTLKGQGDEVPALVEKGKGQFTGPELKGKKLGVIGLGAIGVMVCNIASQFDMDVYGYDPYLSVDAALKMTRSVKRVNSIQEIYKDCDFITLHLPMSKDTKNMINSESIATMKHGVRIVNFSRGELVDSDDMIAALDEKQVYCYVTDFPNDAQLGHPGVIAMPHLGASTPESEENCAEMAAMEIKEFLETGNIRNSVNMPEIQVPHDPSRTRLTIVHRNIPNMITQITAATGGNNIHQLTDVSKGDIAYTIMDMDSGTITEIVDNIKKIDGVVRVTRIR